MSNTVPIEKLLLTFEKSLKTPDFSKHLSHLEVEYHALEKAAQTLKSQALQEFIASGQSAHDFDFRSSWLPTYKRLKRHFLSKKKTLGEQTRLQKTALLEKRETLLYDLRNLVEKDTVSASDQQRVDTLRDSWHALNTSPPSKNQRATYIALLRRFYAKYRILYELKSLDKARNTTQKEQIFQQMEALVNEPLHKDFPLHTKALMRQYMQLGPSTAETAEVQKLKYEELAAAIEEKRRAYFEHEQRILEQKKILYEQLMTVLSSSPTSTKNWKIAKQKVQKISEQWQNLQYFRKHVSQKALNQKFWHAVKSFFKQKYTFSMQENQKQHEVLTTRQELVQTAEQLLEKTPIDLQAFRDLQKQWKNLGAVPYSEHKSIHQQWKILQDKFFAQKEALNAKEQTNYTLYKNFCDSLCQYNSTNTLAIQSLSEILDTLPHEPLSEHLTKKWKSACAEQLRIFIARFFKEHASSQDIQTLQTLLVSFAKKTQLSVAHIRWETYQKLRKEYASAQKELHLLEQNSQFIQNTGNADALIKQIEKELNEQQKKYKSIEKKLDLCKALI